MKDQITIWLVPSVPFAVKHVKWQDEFLFGIADDVVAVTVVPTKLGWKLENIVLDDYQTWRDANPESFGWGPTPVLNLQLCAYQNEDRENWRHVVRFTSAGVQKLQERFDVTVKYLRAGRAFTV